MPRQFPVDQCRHVLIVVYGLLLAHVAEIRLFGIGFMIAERWLELGELSHATTDWFEYILKMQRIWRE